MHRAKPLGKYCKPSPRTFPSKFIRSDKPETTPYLFISSMQNLHCFKETNPEKEFLRFYDPKGSRLTLSSDDWGELKNEEEEKEAKWGGRDSGIVHPHDSSLAPSSSTRIFFFLWAKKQQKNIFNLHSHSTTIESSINYPSGSCRIDQQKEIDFMDSPGVTI